MKQSSICTYACIFFFFKTFHGGIMSCCSIQKICAWHDLWPFLQIKVLRKKPCRLRWCLLSHASHQISPTCSMKVTKAHFGEPSKVKLQLNIVKERLWHAIPDSAKEFPWRKAEDLLLKRLLLVGQKAFKWSLVILFLLSFLADVMYSISRNRELMIPFGLLAGCLMMDFLKEISMEVFQAPEVNSTLCSFPVFFQFVFKDKWIYLLLCLNVFLFCLLNRKEGWTCRFWVSAAASSLWRSCQHILRHFFCMLQMVGWCKFCGFGVIHWKKTVNVMKRISPLAKILN